MTDVGAASSTLAANPATAERSLARTGGRRRSPLSRGKFGALFASPALAFVAIFVLFPLGFAIYLSFTNWPLVGPYHFVGLKNYADIGKDAVFGASVRFTLIYTGIVTLPILLVGYGLAVLVRSNRFGSILFRTAF